MMDNARRYYNHNKEKVNVYKKESIERTHFITRHLKTTDSEFQVL